MTNRVSLLLSLALFGCDEGRKPGEPVVGPCPEMPLYHEAVASLKQDISAAMAQDQATAKTPEVAHPATALSYTYLFDTKRIMAQTEDVMIFRSAAELDALPDDTALKKAKHEIQIDWDKESLVVVLAYPSQRIYVYGVNGKTLTVYAGRPLPCKGYGDETSSMLAYGERALVYRVAGVDQVKLRPFTREYRFNPVTPADACGGRRRVFPGGGGPSVLMEQGRMHMWYEGFSAATGVLFDTWSDDGKSWDPSGWHEDHTCKFKDHSPYSDHYDPSVIRTGDAYWVYFEDLTYQGGEHESHISRSTSTDGLSWTAGTAVLERGPAGAWDESAVYAPYVQRIGQEYWMWYTGVEKSGRTAIGLATSKDGLSWTRWKDNPVLTPGAKGTFEDLGVAHPAVLYHEGVFHMWYSGLTGGASSSRPARAFIAQATSPDGKRWTRSSAPLWYPDWDFEGNHTAFAPEVVLDGDRVLLFYTGLNAKWEPAIGLARCPLAP